MSPDVGERLANYARLLRSSPHNLLSPRGLAELEERHFPEALAFAATLPEGPHVLDVGSGGGIPGIVVAIARPELSVELLDATGKKAEFLVDAVRELGLPVEVHHGRAEELGAGPLRERFDVVTARAVAPLERLVPLAAPFLRVGGTLHAIKGERWSEELAAAQGTLVDGRMEIAAVPDGGGRAAGDDRGPRVVVLRRTADRPGQERDPIKD